MRRNRLAGPEIGSQKRSATDFGCASFRCRMTFREAATVALWSLASYYVWDTSEAATSGPVINFTLTEEKPEAYIESPNYPYDCYPNDTLIVYRVEVKLNSPVRQEQARIQVTFEVFLMERSSFCYKDGLDLVDTTGAVISYCGPQSGHKFLMDDSLILMRMRTDMTGRDRGFRIRVKIYQSECGGIFKDKKSGIIPSPNYPYYYGAHTLCVWRIETHPRRRIILKFYGQFDMKSDNHETCFMDYLDISTTGNLQTDSHRYCGKTQPGTIVSKTHRVVLKFVSDFCNEGSGFNLEFEVVEASILPKKATYLYDPISCQISDCGAQDIRLPKRFGGDKYFNHKYPWLVPIFNHYTVYICAGSLISHNHVLTAAHCCIKDRLLRVVPGVHFLRDLREGSFIKVKRCVMHPAYLNGTLVNDIAVLILEKRIEYSKFQLPICLPIDADDIQGLNGTIAGWTREPYSDRVKLTPEEVAVPLISQSSCVEEFGAIILPTNLCVGGGMADLCLGMNGGPLMATVISKYGKFLQMGIVTTGIGCGRKGHLGIYTRTMPYHDFVYNITGHKWCSVLPPKLKRKSLEYNLYR